MALQAAAPRRPVAPPLLATLAAALAVRVAAASGAGAAGVAGAPVTAVVEVRAPAALRGVFAGRFELGGASVPRPPSGVLVAFAPPQGRADGCAAYGPTPAGARLAVVRVGSCNLAHKAAWAANASATALFVVSQNESLDLGSPEAGAGDVGESEVATIAVRKSLGDALLAALRAGDAVSVGLSVYQPPAVDWSEGLLLSLATSLVALGACCATADLRLGSPMAPRASEVAHVDWRFPFVFFVVGSGMLVVLYFLMKYLIYIIIGLFCLGGWACLMQLAHASLRYWKPVLQRPVATLPNLGKVELAQLLAGLFASAIVATWLLLRNTSHGWLFQDIIGASFLCFIQRTVRLPNLKIASALLSLMFIFDIFWVFISPLFFRSSVMVVVATGGGTHESVPMLLRLPAVGDALGSDRMVGFGDVALPGLLVSFLLRFDVLSGRPLRRGYFLPSVAAYAVGLCATVLALHLMHKGQPALLYLVPCTLGSALLLAWRRGELGDLWRGAPAGASGGLNSQCHYCPGGHALRATEAGAGTCNGCMRFVEEGDMVMDCRQCNWYLCQACRPQDGDAQLSTPAAGPSHLEGGVQELRVAMLPPGGAA